MKLAISAIVLILSTCSAQLAAADDPIVVRSREQLIRAVRDVAPGGRVLIAPGEYRGGLHFDKLRGERNKPIVLAALDPQRPPVFRGGGSCFHLTDPSHVELHNLVLADATGNGLNVDDGGSFGSPARHIVLRGLIVRDVGPEGNRDGIKMSGVDQFQVESCAIERWGSGGSGIDLVGCHDGRIVGCSFRHRSNDSGSGVQAKGGSKDVVIQRCRFDNAGSRAVNIGGSTGRQYFRPKPNGYEAKDITVEDCTFIGSMAPIAFVGVDGAVVRYNTIYRPTRWVVRILQETRDADFVPCRNGSFTNNVIAYRSNELRTAANVGSGTSAESFTFAKNHWYCLDNPPRSNRISLPVKEVGGRFGLDPRFANVKEGDLRLKKTSPVRDAGVRPPG